MNRTTATDYLGQDSLLRLLAVLALVLAPHLLRVQPWIAAAIVAVGLWRAAAALRQWPLPPKWLKVILVVLAFVGTNLSYGRLNGQVAGTALLIIMLALKLMNGPKTARQGNLLAAAGMGVALIATFFIKDEDGRSLGNFEWIALAFVIGSILGTWSARKVQMTSMPQLVALFNGLGGGAVALVDHD